ncbi:MAG: polysaccharide biosynthesis protein [Eubacterium sp.]|nr:polysaccharide biosynthesis protein [Eubacterium sp.]
MEKGIKEKFISSAFFMLAATVIVKVISAVYKIPLTAYIGATGRGYFSIAYNLCMPVHALTMGAFPIALTKLISTYNAQNNTNRIKGLRAASKKLFSIVGIIGMAVVILLSVPYSRIIASSPQSIYTILALAPSILFSCLGVCHRAFCEGFIDMKPTAISQLIEAFTKMIFGLLFARLTMTALYNIYIQNATVFGFSCATELEALSRIYPISSAAAMFGATFGSITSYIFNAVYTRINYKDYSCKITDKNVYYNELLRFSAPLVLATVIQSISNFLDTSSMQYCLSICDKAALSSIYSVSEDVHTYVFGIYATALDFKNLVPSLVMAIGITAVPAISTAFENRADRFASLFNEILKYTSLLSIAGGLALSLFSEEMLALFYSNNNPDIVLNSNKLLFYFGVSILPSCLAITTVSCAQSLGFAKNTILPFAIGAIVRVIINFMLVTNSDINILASCVSNFVGYFIIVIANIITITRKTKVKIQLKSVIIKPVTAGILTYFATQFIKEKLSFVLDKNICLVIMLIIFVVFYTISLITFRLISINDFTHLKKWKKSY